MNPLAGLRKENRNRLAVLLRATKGTITVQQATEALKVSQTAAAKILSQLAAKGWLARVRRGLYVPVAVDAQSTQPLIEDPWVIALAIFNPGYIGGWSAAEYWQFTEQMYRSIVVITSQKVRSQNPVIQNISLYIKNASTDAFFGIQEIWRGQVKVKISDPTRTMIDLFDDPYLGGGIRPIADMFEAYFKSQYKNTDLLVGYGDKLGNRTVFKRLGFIVEKFFPQEKELISACRQRLSQGNSKLDPGLPARRLSTAWKLWIPDNWVEGIPK
jgi:predicted transcriptional regulator of viral defense system